MKYLFIAIIIIVTLCVIISVMNYSNDDEYVDTSQNITPGTVIPFHGIKIDTSRNSRIDMVVFTPGSENSGDSLMIGYPIFRDGDFKGTQIITFEYDDYNFTQSQIDYMNSQGPGYHMKAKEGGTIVVLASPENNLDEALDLIVD